MSVQEEFPIVSKDDAINLKCPHCGKPTRRKGVARPAADPGRTQAMLKDGTCTKCWCRSKGIEPRDYYAGKRKDRGKNKQAKHQITDAEIEQARHDLEKMSQSRRARGIPEEGMSVDEWAFGNGGYYSFEIPGRGTGNRSTGSSRPS